MVDEAREKQTDARKKAAAEKKKVPAKKKPWEDSGPGGMCSMPTGLRTEVLWDSRTMAGRKRRF